MPCALTEATSLLAAVRRRLALATATWCLPGPGCAAFRSIQLQTQTQMQTQAQVPHPPPWTTSCARWYVFLLQQVAATTHVDCHQGALLTHGVPDALDAVAADAPVSTIFTPATVHEPAGRLLEELFQRQRAQASRLGQLSRLMDTMGASEAGAATAAKPDAKQSDDTVKTDAGTTVVT